jgi:hypothetical protein
MISQTTLFRILSGALIASVSCAHATGAVPESVPTKAYPFTASSLEGKYLLKGAFSGDVTLRADSIIVMASSAVLANRMRTSPEHSPLFSDLAVQAYVAVPDGRSWRVAAQSAQVPVGSLGMDADTTLSVAPLRFAIPRPRTPIAAGWLAFELSSHHLPGSPGYQEGKTAFHTYVCAGQYLAPAPGDTVLLVRTVVDTPLTC